MLSPLLCAVGGERRTLGTFPLPPLHRSVKRFYRAPPTGCCTPRPRLGGYLRFFLRPFLRFATAVVRIPRLTPLMLARAVFRVVTLITSLFFKDGNIASSRSICVCRRGLKLVGRAGLEPAKDAMPPDLQSGVFAT